MSDNPKDPINKMNTSNMEENEQSEKVETKLQQVFYKDLSSTIPTLFEQLNQKDQQIQQLNQTVHSLIRKNDELQAKLMVSEDAEFYPVTEVANHQNHQYKQQQQGAAPMNPYDWNFFYSVSKPFIILVALIVFLMLGLKAFDSLSDNRGSSNPTLVNEFHNQKENYKRIIEDYQEKVSVLESEKATNEKQINDLSHAVDTLKLRMTEMTIELAKEGKKEETILTLTEQINQRDQELLALNKSVDSVKRVHNTGQAMVKELKDKTLLLETINGMSQDVGAGKGVFDSNFNLLYLLILIILIGLGFMIFDKRR